MKKQPDYKALRKECLDILHDGMYSDQIVAKQACIKVLRLLEEHQKTCQFQRHPHDPNRFAYVNELQAFFSALVFGEWDMSKHMAINFLLTQMRMMRILYLEGGNPNAT